MWCHLLMSKIMEEAEGVCACAHMCVCMWHQSKGSKSRLQLDPVNCETYIRHPGIEFPSRIYSKEMTRYAYLDSVNFFTALFVSQKLESTVVSSVILESAPCEDYNETRKFSLNKHMNNRVSIYCMVWQALVEEYPQNALTVNSVNHRNLEGEETLLVAVASFQLVPGRSLSRLCILILTHGQRLEKDPHPGPWFCGCQLAGWRWTYHWTSLSLASS